MSGERTRSGSSGIVNHIQRQLDEPLAPADLAALAHRSPFHVHRLLRGMIEGVAEQVRRLGLRAAQGLSHARARSPRSRSTPAAKRALWRWIDWPKDTAPPRS